MLDLLKPFRRSRAEPVRYELQSANPEIWNHPLVRQCYEQMALPRRRIELSVEDKDIEAALLARVLGQWKTLSVEPFWSNDTSDQNKLGKLDSDGIKRFYATGEAYMSVIDAFESRCDVTIPRGVCLELGAGVGKHTLSLAKRFKKVIAVDIIGSFLDILQEQAGKAGRTNIETHVMEDPRQLGAFGPIDFFLAQSVLQSNPPPIQKLMLDSALSALKPGGFALFEIPDWLDGYSFVAKTFLANPPNSDCDGHCIPKADVIRLLTSHGLELIDFAPDFNMECFGCYTYFARKTAANGASGRA